MRLFEDTNPPALKGLLSEISNRAVTSRTINQVISNRLPAASLTDIRQTPGQRFDVELISDSLPIGKTSALRCDEFLAFAACRQKRRALEIRSAAGISLAANLKTDENAMGEGA